jgi:4-amino-4-deoxy-L-arabinose transferase-like glycosyltransferase
VLERADVADGDTSNTNARWFRWGLAAVALLALAVRVTYLAVDRANLTFAGDAYFYHAGANLLVHGHGFIDPYAFLRGRVLQAADHPPLYLLFLAIPSLFGMTSTLTHLLWSCLLGTGTVVIVGLLGRAVMSPRVGILAAVIAALYPNLWVPDGSLQAETVAMFTTAVAVLLAYRYLRQPSWSRLAITGVACGVAALARSELILLVPLLLAPLALSTRALGLRQQLRWLLIGVLATLLVLTPWVGYNLTRFRRPVYLSSQGGITLAYANCDITYRGEFLGYWSLECAAADRRQGHASDDQSQQDIVYQRAALDYMRHHLGRLPVVVAARVGRVLEVFRPGQDLTIREFVDRTEKSIATAALFSFYFLGLLSIAGAFLLRRRRVPIFPVLAPVTIVLITTMATYGNARFRTPAEVVLVVLAAVAIDSISSRIADARARRRVQGPDDVTAPASEVAARSS